MQGEAERPSGTLVEAWGAGLTPDVYMKAMEGGEAFFIATGDLEGTPAVLGFATHRVDDNQDGASVYVRGHIISARAATRRERLFYEEDESTPR